MKEVESVLILSFDEKIKEICDKRGSNEIL